MSLTRTTIFALQDISLKEITIPSTIPVWGGETIFIRQLSRGEQDAYLQRQFGATRMRQDAKAREQEISAVNIYGHDAWLFVHGATDENGKKLFTEADIPALNAKSGEAIGWVAAEIIKFSGMDSDAKVARGEITPEIALADDIKNS